MSSVVLADTGPLIAFARVELLDLLPKVFERVFITQAVVDECLAGKNPREVAVLERSMAELFECVEVSDYSHLLLEIDSGEASAITAAKDRRCGVLMDDKAGRKLARNLGVPVIGTVGVLVLCKRKLLIPAIKPITGALVASGYFLGRDVVASALTLCDESA